MYATLDKNCFTYRVYNGSVIMEEVEPFYSSPEEADSRMFFHTHLSDALPRTVISTDDTDCLLIALGCKHNLDTRVSIWLEIDKESKNNQQYININELHQHVRPKICCPLPAFLTFTGCDYTSSFMGKEKVKPVKLFQKNEAIQDALIVLGEINSLEHLSVMINDTFMPIIKN